MTSYTCPFHPSRGHQDSFCPDCIADVEQLPNPATMTGDERAAEMQRWNDVLTIPFDALHARLEALVGRPVWTHELGTRNWSAFVEEARNRTGEFDMADVIDKFPTDKPVIVVGVGTDGTE